jgi:hypothetical protein
MLIQQLLFFKFMLILGTREKNYPLDVEVEAHTDSISG